MLDYGDINYDKSNNGSFKNKIEIIQYKACIAITDDNQGTSQEQDVVVPDHRLNKDASNWINVDATAASAPGLSGLMLHNNSRCDVAYQTPFSSTNSLVSLHIAVIL